jgi:hypothetical protein
MDKTNERKGLSRREIIKLAGTAAAFCASFGFLLGDDQVRQLKDRSIQFKWSQAQFKFYGGPKLLHSQAVPATVLKFLKANAGSVVEVKLFNAGKSLKTLGTIQGKY